MPKIKWLHLPPQLRQRPNTVFSKKEPHRWKYISLPTYKQSWSR